MERGWIKLYRKLLDSPIFQNPHRLKLAVWALLKATYNEQYVAVKTGKGETMVHLKPGQFLSGRHVAASELNMPPSSARNRLHSLGKAGFLDMQKDRHYSIITVVNWDIYQPSEANLGRQVDNQRTTKGHIQEDNIYAYACEFFAVTHKEHGGYAQAYPDVNLVNEYERMAGWLRSNPEKRPKDYPSFINKWLRRAAGQPRVAGTFWDDLPTL